MLLTELLDLIIVSLQLFAIHHVQMAVHVQMLESVHAFLNGKEITVNKVRILQHN